MIHKATEIRKAIESRDYRAASYITGKAAADYAKQIIEFIGPIHSSEMLAVIAALHVVEISVLSPQSADFVRDTKCAADEIVKKRAEKYTNQHGGVEFGRAQPTAGGVRQ